LYAGAECLLHAALLEGFGLTPLESLAAGTPVVGYRAGAVAEVVGDAGLLVDPLPGALADALCAYLADPALAARLRARTAPRAALFSWDRAAGARRTTRRERPATGGRPSGVRRRGARVARPRRMRTRAGGRSLRAHAGGALRRGHAASLADAPAGRDGVPRSPRRTRRRPAVGRRL
ncbi:MAG: glycosyltransferase, partial [Candidatus Limnocylindria bacterium]